MLYSLRSRLMAAFSILLIIPFTALVYILTEESSTLIQESIEVSTSQTMEQYASHVSTLLMQIEDIGKQLLSDNITQDWLTNHRSSEGTLEDKITAKRGIRNLFTSFEVNSSNGISISAFSDDGGIWTQDTTYLDKEWYLSYTASHVAWTRSHMDPDQSDISFKMRSINSYVLPLAHLQTFTNEGIIKVNYPTSLLQDPIDRIRFGRTGKVYLLDEQGRSVLLQNLSDNKQVLLDSIGEVQSHRSGKSNGIFSLQHNGVRYLIFYRALPAQNWMLLGVVPEGELYSKIGSIRNTMLVVSGVLLIVAIIAAFGFSRGITKPLSRMAQAMKQVQRGDFSRAVELMPHMKPEQNEVGYVTSAFEQMTYRLRDLIETEYETNLRRKNAEYKALLLQINPHFYNNTLEIISGLAAMKREDLVMDATEALGKMMRYSLNLHSDVVKVHQEFEYIRDYLFILKLRYDDYLHVSIEEDSAADQLEIAKFILQPLVENAVKYSLEKDGRAKVYLKSSLSEDQLSLTVSDNGIGMSPELVEDLIAEIRSKDAVRILDSKGYSIGLRNVLARCRLQYGDAFEVTIDSGPECGTTIILKLPMHRR